MKAAERSSFPLVSVGVFAVALVAVVAVQVTDLGHSVPSWTGGGAASLPACPFWTSGSQPPGAVTPFSRPPQQAPVLDLGGRLPAPAIITGQLTGHQVLLGFDHVAGAQEYRVWRNGLPVALVPDAGRPSLTATDPRPCASAFYTVQAMADQSGADAARGQLSRPYQLAPDGTVGPWSTPPDTSIRMTVISYSEGGQAASGYDTRPGICAVDPRVIPWGVSFAVPDYGHCYAADVYPAAQGRTVAVWLPPAQASAWGVQDRVISLGVGAPPLAVSPSPTPSPARSPTPSPSPAATPAGQARPNPAPSPFSAGYEAESPANILSGGARVGACAGCSGGFKVRFIGMGGLLQFNGVTVPSSGDYQLAIAYVNGDRQQRWADVSIDGGSRMLVGFAGTGSWSAPSTVTITVHLNAGAHTVSIFNPSDWGPDVDAIRVTSPLNQP